MTEQTTTDETTDDQTRDDTAAEGQQDDTTDMAADTTDWKAMARKHEREAKSNREAAKELAALKAKDQTETERIAAERDAATERVKTATRRAVTAEVKAVAAGLKFQDPADALRLLDLDDLVDDDGEVDEKAVADALQGIADKKPYLLASTSTTTSRSGGEINGGSTPAGEKSVDDFVAEFNKR